MPGLAMVAVEGVLANHFEQPINTGIALYHALKTQYRLVLVTEWDLEKAKHWVTSHGLTNYDQLIGRPHTRPHSDNVGVGLRRWQLQRLRAAGAVIDLVIDSNPGVAAMGMFEGACALLFAHPFYARPEFRPDNPRRPRAWDEIVEEIDRQRAAYAEDTRRVGVEDAT